MAPLECGSEAKRSCRLCVRRCLKGGSCAAALQGLRRAYAEIIDDC
jgi:hypothetical protein